VRIVRELQGVLGRIGANQGLIVAWAGMNKKAEAEVRRKFFQVRVMIEDPLASDRDQAHARYPLRRTFAWRRLSRIVGPAMRRERFGCCRVKCMSRAPSLHYHRSSSLSAGGLKVASTIRRCRCPPPTHGPVSSHGGGM